MFQRNAAFLALLGLAGCAYEAPVDKTYVPSNTIAGTIVADGVTEIGDVWVFVFDAKAPPPPVGTGAPITFSTVPASRFTGDGAGVQSAPYAVPYLADTTEETGFEAGYLVTALMDVDGNFNPFATALAGSTCGDYLGEHTAGLGSPYPEPVFVEGGEVKDEITITISRRNDTQRPAFTLADPDLVISKSVARASLVNQAANTQTYRVIATGVHTEYPAECPKGEKCDPLPLDLDGPCAQDPSVGDAACGQLIACSCPPDIQAPCQTGFPVHFVDRIDNATGDPVPDGLHDPYPAELQAANGIKDTWPRVFLDYLGVPTSDPDGNTIFENDLGTFEWPEGSGRYVRERWVAENYPMALELVVPGIGLIHPDPDNKFDPFMAKEMQITFSPAFRHYHPGGTYDVDPANGPYDLFDLRCYADPNFGDGQFPSGDPDAQHPASCVPGQPVSLDDVPNGAWQMVLITESGQSWWLPNDIGLPARAAEEGVDNPLQATDPTFDPATQGVYLMLGD